MTASRFAPSTTGLAHPGTLLSALLVVLDAEARGLQKLLRFEDLDPERCKAEFDADLAAAVSWMGLSFDFCERQSENIQRYEAALDELEGRGLLYPCAASRSELKRGGRRAPDGAYTYDNRSRGCGLPAGGWRACSEPIRVRLPDDTVRVLEGGGGLIEHDLRAFGDPVVRRRDGAIAYHLASVVDDGAAEVSRIVRGRDLREATVVQVALQRYLGIPTPLYDHHPLLLEERGSKLAKLHGSVHWHQVREKHDSEEVVAFLAGCVGLNAEPRTRQSVTELARGFSWERVASTDVTVALEATLVRR